MNIEDYSKLKVEYDMLIANRKELTGNLKRIESEIFKVNLEAEKIEIQLLNALKDMKAEIQSDAVNIVQSDAGDTGYPPPSFPELIGGSAISENATEESEDDLIPESKPEE